MTTSILGIAAGYVVLAVLLLSLNLTSLWRWWIKAGAILVTTGFAGATYLALDGLMGWPTARPLPPRFNLLWTRIVEPDKKTNSAGATYIWVEELDDNNVPASTPRSYRLSYADALARKIAAAQEQRDRGVDVMGRIDEDLGRRETVTGKTRKIGRIEKNREHNAAADTVPFMDDAASLSFEALPPVILPEKGPL